MLKQSVIVRSIPDCVASLVLLAKPTNLTEFLETSPEIEQLKRSYQVLSAQHAAKPGSIEFIDYDDIAGDQHDRVNAKEVLGYHYAFFCQPEFWLKEPKTKPMVDDLDLQLTASITGDFEEGRRIADKLAKERPDDSRAAFNRGWYELRDGKIQLGYSLMHRGRRVEVFGDRKANTSMPLWEGQKGVVMLVLEGGLGDQIHQARYAANLTAMGCSVIVSCAPTLAPVIKHVAGVSAIVQHGSEGAVYHEYWMPAMSAPMFLKMELADLSGKPYIPIPAVEKHDGIRIGLRWSGNKAFEDQHHKLFPAEPFFAAVKNPKVEFISLQRDADTQFRPSWVKEVPLDTWEATRKAVASCDLIISSCTSVSHLSAAMGIPTWVVIPIMAYFLYAMPGERTPYYDCMRLFRQKKYGDWSDPMKQLNKALKLEIADRLKVRHNVP